MNHQIYEEAAEWLVELRSRDDATTRKRFDEWLSSSPEHIRAYLECAAVSETLEAEPRGTPLEIDALIERARRSAAENVIPLVPEQHARDASESDVTPERDAPVRRSWMARSSRALRFAAAAMLLLVVGTSASYFVTRNDYATAVGEQRSILLSDGSTVDLNGRSKVRVRFHGRTRAVDLMEGEALFRVAPDKARPFIVSAYDMHVRAVGTEFAVNRRTRDLVVTVVDGTVAVSPLVKAARAANANSGSTAANRNGSAPSGLAPTRDEILVDAGQQLALSLAPVAAGSALPEPRAVNVNDAIAWTRRRLVFNSTPLEEVVAEFNRHSARTLVIRGSGLQDFHVSGAFSSTDVAPFLGFLRAQPGVQVIEEQDEIVIVHR